MKEISVPNNTKMEEISVPTIYKVICNIYHTQMKEIVPNNKKI